MKIGILQTGHVPDDLAQNHGHYEQMFSTLLGGYGFEFANYAVVDNEFPATVDECDGWLITGSRHGAYEDHDWIPPLEDLIRNIYAADVPLVGVCFGHQIMAQALGGKVEKFGGLWGVGNLTYTTTDGSQLTLLAMHQDQVTQRPPEATVTVTSEFCENAGLAYKGNAMSIQPHPEFTPAFMRELINMRKGTVIPDDQAGPALEKLDVANDSAAYAKKIAEFFKASRAA